MDLVYKKMQSISLYFAFLITKKEGMAVSKKILKNINNQQGPGNPDEKRLESEKRLLKMKSLSEATGVAKSTILLYVKKGLLPEPVKTSPNMAYYDPVCIERVKFIKNIQASRRLPLSAIKGLLKEMDNGRDVSPLLELQTTLFGGAGEKMDTASFCKNAGLTPEELNFLCCLELIIPLEDSLFDSHDLNLARQIKKCMDVGIDPKNLTFYPEYAKKIVTKEIQMREKYTKDLGFKEDAMLTLEMTQMARGLRAYVIDRKLQKELIKFKGLKKNKPEVV